MYNNPKIKVIKNHNMYYIINHNKFKEQPLHLNLTIIKFRLYLKIILILNKKNNNFILNLKQLN